MSFQTFLIVVIGGMLAPSLMIVILFVIIYGCIRRKAAKYTPMTLNNIKRSQHTASSLKQNGLEEVRPPLPPRSQFDSQSLSNSYEDMPEILPAAEEPSCLTSKVILPTENQRNFQDNVSVAESYEEVDMLESAANSYEDVSENPVAAHKIPATNNAVIFRPPETQIHLHDNVSVADSYDDIGELQNAQNSYEDVVSLPDYLEVEPSPFHNKSESASENYDDIDQLHSDDDYDDVG